MLQNNVAVRIYDEPDIKEAILPVLMARLGLRHDENIPLARPTCRFRRFPSPNVDATSAGVIGMVYVQDFIIETHQCALGDRKQAHRDVELESRTPLGKPLEVVDVLFDLFASANSPETGDQAYGVIGSIMPTSSDETYLSNRQEFTPRRSAIRPGPSQVPFHRSPVQRACLRRRHVRLHIKMAVTGEIEENGLLFALFLAA